MVQSSKELLHQATGAINRALLLLQDPVLLAVRHLPPAPSIYEQLSNSLLHLSMGLRT